MGAETKVGAPCLAFLGDGWIKAKVARENEDGTYDVTDGTADSLFDRWHGVTRDELSFDDLALFGPLFDVFRGSQKGLDRAAAGRAFADLGVEVNDENLANFWADRCKTLAPGVEPEHALLDRDQAHELFVSAGIAAKQIATRTFPSKDLYKLYWNQVRMGGRAPRDVGASKDLCDALAALRLASTKIGKRSAAEVAAFMTQHGVVPPKTLVRLWSRKGAVEAIKESHCNNPEPRAPKLWELRRREASSRFEGQLAVKVMDPHQGDHGWWVVFDDGADDGEVWLSFEENGPPVVRVARSVAFFFWDLAETGRCWEASEAG